MYLLPLFAVCGLMKKNAQVIDVNSITQLDVRWLVCSGAIVAEYVKALHRCAQNLQLCLVQVLT